MKILVTGATGFVGKHLCNSLLNKEHAVISLGRKKIEHSRIKNYIVTDLTDQNNMIKAFKDVDVVVHLAARAHKINDNAVDPLDEFRKVNVDITRAVCECAKQAAVKRFILLSSAGVYGEYTSGSPFSENSEPKPEAPYAISKLEAEIISKEILKNTKTEYIILRPPLIYGPECPGNFLRLLRLVKLAPLLPFGSANKKKSFIYVGNLIEAICICLDNENIANSEFVLSDDSDFSLSKLTSKLQSMVNGRSRNIKIPIKALELITSLIGQEDLIKKMTSELLVDGTKFRLLTGWSPPINPEDALERTTFWFKNL